MKELSYEFKAQTLDKFSSLLVRPLNLNLAVGDMVSSSPWHPVQIDSI